MWTSRFRLGRLWQNLVHRDRVERELDDELASTFDLLVEEHVRRGMTAADASRATTLQLGRTGALKEQIRDSRSGASIDAIWQDVRFGARLLRRSPAFALSAIVSLALGIGANAAVFGLLNALQLRSLPVARASELAEVRLDGPRCCRHTGRNRQVSLPLWQEIAKHQEAFSDLFAFADTRFNLAPHGEVRYIEGLFVSGGFFSVLGVTPALGRPLGPADDQPGCANAGAVISHALWQSEFHGRADVLTRSITLRTAQHPIVGVMPASFFGVEVGRRAEVALPLCASGFNRPDHWWLAVMGRLKTGWTADQATAHLAALGPSLLGAVIPATYNAEQARAFVGLRLSARAAGNGVSPLRTEYRNPLAFLLAIAVLVLLTACANVASLSLVRATAREGELAMRYALGATRRRVARQLLTEGLLIAAAGTAAGLILARFAQNAVMAVLSTRTDPIVLDLTLDWRSVAFTATAAAVTALSFAVLPTLRATRAANLGAVIGRTTATRERMAARELLLGLQVAMSVVLVSAALLFALTVRNLSSLDPGFARDNVLVANVFMSDVDYPPPSRAAMHQVLTRRLAETPGVAGVAYGSTPPLVGSTWGTVVRVAGPSGEREGEANRNEVTSGYFGVIGTALLAGRDFDRQDTPLSPKVAIVNETFARKFFDGGSALGQRFTDGGQQFEIIGLVRDSKLYFLREEFRPIAYTAASQVAVPGTTIRFLLRLQTAPGPAMESVRQALANFSPSAAVRFATMSKMAVESIQRERLLANLSAFFGLVSIALAAVGVYGVVSYTATSRRREIGIRLTLGARAADVLRAVLGRVAVVSGAGLALGGLLALAASDAAASFLYQVELGDPSVLLLIAAVVVGSAAIAVLVPARRALRTDPVVALRSE